MVEQGASISFQDSEIGWNGWAKMTDNRDGVLVKAKWHWRPRQGQFFEIDVAENGLAMEDVIVATFMTQFWESLYKR